MGSTRGGSNQNIFNDLVVDIIHDMSERSMQDNGESSCMTAFVNFFRHRTFMKILARTSDTVCQLDSV